VKNPTLYYRMALVGYFGLLILVLLWEIVILPSTTLPIAPILAAKLIPLLFPLRGLLHGRTYTCAWAASLSMLYFIHGVLAVFSTGTEQLLAALEILFSQMLFLGCTFYIRFHDEPTASDSV